MNVTITANVTMSAAIKNLKNVTARAAFSANSNPFAMATDAEEMARYCARKCDSEFKVFDVGIIVVDADNGVNIEARLDFFGEHVHLTTINDGDVTRVPLQNDDGSWFGFSRSIRTMVRAASDMVVAKF